MSDNYAADLKAHLDGLGIECTVTGAGNVSVKDAKKLLAHLTDEAFIGREPWEKFAALKKSPHPVPLHRTDNPIGALQEWCQGRGPNAKMPAYSQSENIGTVHAPMFECSVRCDGVVEVAQDANKNGAKRKAAQQMLVELAKKYGARTTER